MLTTPLIRFTKADGGEVRSTLPGVMAALMRDEVVAFSALRPHQRHCWHAFLTQIGALALLRADRTDLPELEDSWRDLIRGLTPDDADDAPWSLLTAHERPALLQPPIPVGTLGELKNLVLTPDGIDMLVTSRNHDLKASVMMMAEVDDWLFALLSLQTMEGFLGAGNYGISRMNGGFANRPALGLAAPGGPGAHVRRDIISLLQMKGRPPLSDGCAREGGLALVWLRPWNGQTAIPVSELDPLYIEICRRVRLVEVGGRIAARVGGSKTARIAATQGGVTGDPWTPVRRDKEGQKALTVDARGFSYRPLVELLYPRNGDPSPLQEQTPHDAQQGLTLIARALVRGQGKTEGYHERRVPLSRRMRRGFGTASTDPVSDIAHDRVKLVSEMSGALRRALISLFENGPEPAQLDVRDEGAGRKAATFLAQFEREVDLSFFDDLVQEADLEHAEARAACRSAWARSLLSMAEKVLAVADHSAAKATQRRYRARVRAQSTLQSSVRRPSGSLASLLKLPEAVDG